MAELQPSDVEEFTDGDLKADDAQTAVLLAAAVSAARRYCEWHVTPVKQTTDTLDGWGERTLALPTLRLVTLDEISENGAAISVPSLEISIRGLVRKPGRSPWTDRLGGIAVKMTHGFEDAADFNAAVLQSLVDHLDGTAGREVIGPFEYEAGEILNGYSGIVKARLDSYRLESTA